MPSTYKQVHNTLVLLIVLLRASMILRRVLARRVLSRSMHTSYWHAHTSGTFCPGVSDLRKNNFCAKNSHTPHTLHDVYALLYCTRSTLVRVRVVVVLS